MTPEALAQIHTAAFAPERGWSADEFRQLCASPLVTLTYQPGGFLLTRTMAQEAEILTFAVSPTCQRQGIASKLLEGWLKSTLATEVFLEVADDNAAARDLYTKHGFAVAATRPRYYARPDGSYADALLMKVALTYGQRP